jgi:hypothetical protein
MMDPIGYALENYDVVGLWRTKDSGVTIDASGTLGDGTPVNGPGSLRDALLRRSDLFERKFTQDLLMYGMGRVLQPYDMPAVRAIQRDAAASGKRFSAIVLGIVKSVPFQMRQADDVSSTTDAADKPPAIH